MRSWRITTLGLLLGEIDMSDRYLLSRELALFELKFGWYIWYRVVRLPAPLLGLRETRAGNNAFPLAREVDVSLWRRYEVSFKS